MIRIRAAGPDDAVALARLRYEFRSSLAAACEPEEAFRARCGRWMAERLAHPHTWRCWLAERDGIVAGMIWMHPVEKLPNPVEEAEMHAYVTSFYVDPAARNGGVGSALLAACLRECEDIGVDAIILWPTPRSRGLYARHGFSVRDDIMEKR
jgi:GNAT superfamily N-acetyltransferase